MATTTAYNRFLKKLTATAAFGLLTATSQAGLFLDWKTDHKRPYCTPACDDAWGYHDACWRQFPPTQPCTDWGAHCSACATGDGINYGGEINPGLNAGGYPGIPIGPQIQQPLLLQQHLGAQNFQLQGPPINYGVPQGNGNSYNANPAPVPPSGQVDQQPANSRSFAPGNVDNLQPPSKSMKDDMENKSDGGQLQLPGLEDDAGDFQLPAIPDLSRYNPRTNGQAYGNQYQSVSQSTVTGNYGQPLYPDGNAAAAYAVNGMANQPQYGQQPGSPAQYGQQQYAQQQYGQQQYNQQQYNQQQYGQQQYGPAQSVQPQPAYAQPMLQQQQQMMVPGSPQQGNQYHPSQRRAIQVAPGQRPSVVGVSFSQSIRPATNHMNVQQPMPVQKQSFLSKINPFSK